MIIGLMGSDHKVGTSSLAKKIAAMIAKEKKDENILYLVAQSTFFPEFEYSCSLMELYSMHKSNTIVHKPFTTIQLTPGSVIDGNMDAIRTIFEEIAKKFTVIIDCGINIPETGVGLGALYSCDKLIRVITQNEYCLKREEWMAALNKALKLPNDIAIVNKYDSDRAYDLSYIKERLGCENLFKVSDYSEGMDDLYPSLIFCKSPKLESELKKVINHLYQ